MNIAGTRPLPSLILDSIVSTGNDDERGWVAAYAFFAPFLSAQPQRTRPRHYITPSQASSIRVKEGEGVRGSGNLKGLCSLWFRLPRRLRP